MNDDPFGLKAIKLDHHLKGNKLDHYYEKIHWESENYRDNATGNGDIEKKSRIPGSIYSSSGS